MTWHGPEISAELRAVATDALHKAGEAILEESNRHVPHDLGDLEGSGEVSTDTHMVQANISYDRPYAVRQHEELSYRHKAGRTAKYLENALKKLTGEVMNFLGSELRKKIGG